MKYTLTLLLCCTIISFNSFSQITIKAQRTFGGNKNDELQSMEFTKDGGIILGGLSSSGKSGDKSEKSKGHYDYWVIKLAKNGKKEWDKTIGGGNDDYLVQVKPTADGGYILGGNSYSNMSGDKSENHRTANAFDYWIVKLDSAGNKVWDKTVGGDRSDELHGLVQTKDDGYLLGGWSSSNAGFDKTAANIGCWDYWVVKLDANGQILWDKTLGGTDCDDLGALDTCSDGGFIICGYSVSGVSVDKTDFCRGGFDYWAVKLDSAGNILWDKTYGGGNEDYCTVARQTKDKGFIFAGYSYSGQGYEKSEPSRGAWDYWIIKTDSAGTLQWNKTIGSSYNDFLTDTRETSDGGYITGGYSSGPVSGEKSENGRGDYDYWIAKLNTNGNFVADKTVGGSNGDYMYSVLEKNGNYTLGGYSLSPVSGDKTDSVSGIDDYWIVRLSNSGNSFATPGLNGLTATQQNKNLLAFPNPVKDKLQLQSTVATTITITDQAGKVWLTKNINGNATINLGNLPAGLYYLTDKNTGASQKILVTH